MKTTCRSAMRAHYRVKAIVTHFFFLKKTSCPIAQFISRENSQQEQKRVNLGTNALVLPFRVRKVFTWAGFHSLHFVVFA